MRTPTHSRVVTSSATEMRKVGGAFRPSNPRSAYSSKPAERTIPAAISAARASPFDRTRGSSITATHYRAAEQASAGLRHGQAANTFEGRRSSWRTIASTAVAVPSPLALRRPMLRPKLCCVWVLERYGDPAACVLSAPIWGGWRCRSRRRERNISRAGLPSRLSRCGRPRVRSTRRACKPTPARNFNECVLERIEPPKRQAWRCHHQPPRSRSSRAFNPSEICCGAKLDPLHRQPHTRPRAT